jgi:ketosteroid isomerase-like protein
VATELAEELQWVSAVLRIQQLAARYALAVDSRDLPMLASLFVPDVQVGSSRSGRQALESWYAEALRSVGPTIHLLANHSVEVEGDVARGVVYCREEVQSLNSEEWRIGMLQYWDDYRQVEGTWLFQRRQVRRWYTHVDSTPEGWETSTSQNPKGPREQRLPEAFPTWSSFYGDNESIPS